jgi:hypothetical protein
MLVRTLTACVFVSPYRAREPCGAFESATPGTVPEVHTTAALAGIATVFEMGPRPPVNVTVLGGPPCACIGVARATRQAIAATAAARRGAGVDELSNSRGM